MNNGKAVTDDVAQCPLEVHDLTVAYHRRPVLWDVDFRVPDSSLIGIVGPNGANSSATCRSAKASTGIFRPMRWMS
jgi:manganese/zinc/iron transport system ATP- binding protein